MSRSNSLITFTITSPNQTINLNDNIPKSSLILESYQIQYVDSNAVLFHPRLFLFFDGLSNKSIQHNAGIPIFATNTSVISYAEPRLIIDLNKTLGHSIPFFIYSGNDILPTGVITAISLTFSYDYTSDT